MAIIELTQLKNFKNHKFNNMTENLVINHQDNFFQLLENSSIINQTNPENFISNEEIYHKNYLGLLIITMILFFILSYYLYYISKYNIKRAKINNSDNNTTYLKYTNLQNLSIATFCK